MSNSFVQVGVLEEVEISNVVKVIFIWLRNFYTEGNHAPLNSKCGFADTGNFDTAYLVSG